jgi:acyl carrier protein
MNDIEDKLRSIVSEYIEEDFEHATASQSFDELGIDSLSLVEIIFDIEEAFNIKIPDDNVLDEQGRSVSSYADILLLVKNLIKERQEDV